MTRRAYHVVPVSTLIVVTACVLAGGSAAAPPATRPSHGPATRPSTQPATRPDESPRWVRLPPGAASVTVPLRTAGDLLFAQVRVNGTDIGWFLIDTCFTMSVVEKKPAAELQLKPFASTRFAAVGGAVTEAELVRLPRLSIGPADGPAVECGPTVAAVHDLTLVGIYLGVKPDGVIGYDLLSELPFTLDVRAGTLTLHDPGRFAPPRDAGEPVPVERRGDVPAVPGRIEGTPGWFALDTGYQGMGDLSGTYRRLYPELLRGKTLLPFTSANLTGTHEEASAEFAELQVLGRSRGPVRLTVGSEQVTTDVLAARTAGKIGMELLRDARLTFDGPGKRLWCHWHPEEPADAMVRRLGDPNSRDLAGQTPLMAACARRRADVVRLMLDARADPNLKCNTGRTALMRAAGDTEIVRLLLARGADANAQASVRGHTPLNLAVEENNLATVQALLAAGADPGKADTTGGTPLHRAAFAGRDRIAAALIAAGADVHARTKPGWTPLHIAAAQDGVEGVLLLTRAKADPNAASEDGSTPLMYAAHYGNMNVARALLDNGADVDASPAKAQGGTALMFAARAGNLPVVRLLLERGADPAARSTGGKDALEVAASAGRRDVMRFLAFYDPGEFSGRPPSSRPTALPVPPR